MLRNAYLFGTTCAPQPRTSTGQPINCMSNLTIAEYALLGCFISYAYSFIFTYLQLRIWFDLFPKQCDAIFILCLLFRNERDVKIVHFLGASKPWQIPFDSAGQPMSNMAWDMQHNKHLFYWWQIYNFDVKRLIQTLWNVNAHLQINT